MTKKNICNDCDHIWFPRGSIRSAKCPSCGGRHISIEGAPLRHVSVEEIDPPKGGGSIFGIIVALILIFVIYRFISSYDQAKPVVENNNIGIPHTQNNVEKHNSIPEPSAPATNKVSDLTSSNNESIDQSSKAQTSTYSDEEVLKMEDEKQYHGDDPIVRRRLGLPPKNGSN